MLKRSILYMDSDKKRLLVLIAILLGVVVFAVGVSFVLPLLERGGKLPSEISDARFRAGEISADVVRLSNEANDRIKALGALDASKEQEKAAGLIKEAEDKNKEAYEKAVALSNELAKMAEKLPEVQSEKVKQVLQQSITVEIALVTEFIQYSKDLNLFLDQVNEFISNSTPANRARLQSMEITVNERVGRINQLNEEFLRHMETLDKLTK